ncbi:hypothetical protein C8F04DRAFT_105454 [Mycena alexandri]|uniref:Uncharacterized protein n=1 Tax=Mycena alexandri TaxID=1745969 RepID=A0AAD6WX55_9AGAR|nr:hypothetical protein C8F04DRAFT_105454 [Mycena alexandri]
MDTSAASHGTSLPASYGQIEFLGGGVWFCLCARWDPLRDFGRRVDSGRRCTSLLPSFGYMNLCTSPLLFFVVVVRNHSVSFTVVVVCHPGTLYLLEMYIFPLGTGRGNASPICAPRRPSSCLSWDKLHPDIYGRDTGMISHNDFITPVKHIFTQS